MSGRGQYTPVARDPLLPLTQGENDVFFDAEFAAAEPAPGTSNQHTNTPPHELDPVRHSANEGPSSSLASAANLGSQVPQNPDGDLENQAPITSGRLSAASRLKNVVTYFFPFKQTYERLNNGLSTGRLQLNAPGRFVGQGTDGVFRNLMAKPDTDLAREVQEQHPPTYEEAAADSSPEYWEATMISPMYEDEVFVHGLPVGNIANFVWNVLVTVAFQLVGFVLCYLLHTSHAAKQGTRAGLGITIIMYGYNLIPANSGRTDRLPTRYEPIDANQIDISLLLLIKNGDVVDTYLLGFVPHTDANSARSAFSTPFLAYAIIAFGILVGLKACADFWSVKREEKRILAPQALEEVHSTTEPVTHPPPL